MPSITLVFGPVREDTKKMKTIREELPMRLRKLFFGAKSVSVLVIDASAKSVNVPPIWVRIQFAGKAPRRGKRERIHDELYPQIVKMLDGLGLTQSEIRHNFKLETSWGSIVTKW